MVPASFWTLLSVLNFVIIVVTTQHILRTRRDPRGMMTWILALLLLPFLGMVLYLLIGGEPIRRRVHRRRRHRRMIEPELTEQTVELARSHDARDEEGIDETQRELMQFATRVSGAVVTGHNAVEVEHDAEHAFLNLGLAIEAAREHVHLEYYIYADDDTGRGMRNLLVKKAQEGVEVRLLLDAVGCWKLSRSFVRDMREKGVEVEFFLPWGFSTRRFQLNCRNHRKLAVIDGEVGFFGSKNIADEYLGRKKKYGPWRDTHLRVAGPCVAQLQEVFVEDWHFATKKNLSSDRYFPPPAPAGDRVVQIVPSGPGEGVDTMHQLLYAAVSDSHRSIAFITPYFVPDKAMLLTLMSAAYRGVRVQLLIPSRTDNWFVLWAGRTFYEELLSAGVEIYEYDKGMLHSKVAIVDERWAMVGSANMDIRSFRINFELTSILYDNALAHQLQIDFDELCAEAGQVERRQIESWSYGQTLAAGVARLATPLL